MNSIEISNIIKSYNSLEVVNIPELSIPKGESFGLVGNNGAGKTTLFRMVLDLIRPNEGFVTINEENVQTNESWKSFTGSFLDEGSLVEFLTPDEYFEFIGDVHNMSKGDVSDFLDSFEDIFNDEIRGKKKYIRDLSKGNQKKVGIAAALMPNPEIIMLDEPFANLDPSTQIRLKKYLNQIKQDRQVTMLISSHDLSHVTEVCDRIVVLEKGKIIHDMQTSEGTLAELETYFDA